MKTDLYLGDCLEVMKSIPSASVDMVLCDLPYGTTQCKWDTIIPFKPLWAEYRRVAKDGAAVVLFGAEPFSSALRMSNIESFKYDWVWLKNKPDGFLNSKHQPMRENEIVSVFGRGKLLYNPQLERCAPFKHKKTATGVRSSTHGAIADKQPEYEIRDYKYPKNVLRFDKPSSRQHPTQKPVPLLEYLIRTYTNDGMTVLDNCMGSGSTGVACLNTNRNFIGIEQDPGYFDIAKTRIEQTQKAFEVVEQTLTPKEKR
jgi:DNA modification methylase